MIRQLNENDTAAFLGLKKRGLSSDPYSFVASIEEDSPSYPDTVRNRLRNASIRTGDIVLGVFSPDLIGIIAITQDNRIKRRHKANLHGMYVLPEHRGKGLGKALLDQALIMAREISELEEIQLIVSTDNQAVVGLYEKVGFRSVWTEIHALKLNDRYVDSHHMVLDLRTQSPNHSLHTERAWTDNLRG